MTRNEFTAITMFIGAAKPTIPTYGEHALLNNVSRSAYERQLRVWETMVRDISRATACSGKTPEDFRRECGYAPVSAAQPTDNGANVLAQSMHPMWGLSRAG